MTRVAPPSATLLACVLGLLLVYPAAESRAADAADSPFTIDDLMLLEATVDNRALTDSLGAYSSRAGLYLPLGELSRLLDLPLQVDPPARRVSGWFLSESRRFELVLDKRVAEVDGRSVSFEGNDAVLFQDEVYLRLELMAKLLPLNFTPDLRSLSLKIMPREKLPAQERLERDQNRRGLGTVEQVAPPLRVSLPYEAFTPPAADLSVSLGTSNIDPGSTTQWQARLAGDLAYAGAQLYLGSDQQGKPAAARLQLERRIAYGSNEQDSGMVRVVAGDIFTTGLAMGIGNHEGRGISVSNAPIQQTSVFQQTDLRGELPEGYEVELYINEVLRASQAAGINGRYEFLNVPLSYGLNVIRLAFYGPRGERHQEIRRLNVGGGQLPTGRLVASFSAVQQGQLLVPLVRTHFDPQLIDPGYGSLQWSAGAAYGVNSWLTVHGGVGAVKTGVNNSRQIVTGGIASGIGNFALNLDVVADNKRGMGEQLGLAGRIAGVPLLLQHAQYQGGFVDDRNGFGSIPGAELKSYSLLRSDLPLRLPGMTRLLPVSLQASRSVSVDGSGSLLAYTRLSIPIGRFLNSYSLSYDHSTNLTQPPSKHLQGSLDLTSLFGGRWQLRAATAFYLRPKAEVFSSSVTLDRRLSTLTSIRAAIDHGWTEGGTTQLSAGTTWRLRFMDISLVGSYVAPQNFYSVNLNFSIGTLFDALRGRYRSAGPDAAVTGALLIDAYLDRSGNGVRQPGDPGIAGLGANSSRGPVVADSSGNLLVTGLASNGNALVPLRMDSIDDPYLLPPARTLELQPRAGRVAVANFPMQPTGEASLRFLIALTPESTRGISALAVEVIDAAGEIAARGRTEYDGTVLFEGLKPGHYTVRLQTEQSSRLGLVLMEEVTLDIPTSGGYIGSREAHIAVRR